MGKTSERQSYGIARMEREVVVESEARKESEKPCRVPELRWMGSIGGGSVDMWKEG